jgi:hypothetical protein
MTYTEFDIKLIRHALDTNSEGEARNAAAMFFKELRKRGIKAHEFLASAGNGNSASPSPAPNSSETNIDYKARYEAEVQRSVDHWRSVEKARKDLAECKTKLSWLESRLGAKECRSQAKAQAKSEAWERKHWSW